MRGFISFCSKNKSVMYTPTSCLSMLNIFFFSIISASFEIAPAVKPKKRKPTPQKVIHKGFVYHLRLHHGKTRYFRCAKERYTGCTATAKLEGTASSEHLKVIRPHNHPPDGTIEVKVVFETQLRKAVQNMTNLDNRSIYNLIATIYPESAEIFPFGSRLNSTLGNRPRKKKAKSDRIVLNGFVYHTSVVRHNPAVRYLVCSKYLSAGCRGRAILPINADHSKLRITQAHNHPPDNKVEDKFAFMSKLKMAVQNVPNASLKTVFDELVELYPKISNEYCYESLRSSLRRWRKEADH